MTTTTKFFPVITLLLTLLGAMPCAAEDFISEQPEGDVTYYDRLSYGWYIYAGGNNIQYGPVPGATKLVSAADGTVYIQDPLTANKMGTYIKARREGSKIVAQFPQVLGEIEDNNGTRPLYIGVMANFKDSKGTTYMPVGGEEENRVTWTVHDDGTITMDHRKIELDERGKFKDMTNLPDSVLGTYYYGTDDLTGEYGAIWNAVADWEQTYTPIETQDILTIPEGLNKEVWRMTTTKDTRMVDIAFDGNIVYMGNFTQHVPGAIKGYLQDGKVSFPTTQYLGFSEKANANAWFISATAEYIEEFGKKFLSKFIRTDALVFTYDAEKKTLESQADDCFLVNASVKETNHFEYVVDPNLEYLPPEGMDANPQNPTIVNPGESKGNDGLLFSANIPAENVNGVALNTNNMFYNIYLNGELWEFCKDTYNHIEAGMTDIPYSYTDKYDLQLRGLLHELYLHEEGIKSVGIQSCYRGSDGTVYRSDIITAGTLPETGTSPVEEIPSETIGALPETKTVFTYYTDGVEQEPSGTGKKETYDVAIALTNAALTGKAITKIRVPVLVSPKVGDFSVWLAKELKTKLVGGKNTNIVNKKWTGSIEGSGDEAFFTVTLDEPYVIPEGGLYVGYSLTVNEVDRSVATQVPIVTAKTAKQGGFFLRTSRSFLDWKDRSEEFNVVAMTEVEIAGSFYVNAATVGEIPFSYLAVNKEQTVSIPIYNIGQSPINSLDYTTTLGAKSYSGSLTLEKPMPAVYAYTENVALTVPAVEEMGESAVSVKITGVNGKPNDATEKTEAQNSCRVVKFVPKHLALMEEFTGTWCGWCPSGFVAMEKMSELYPDFVGITYHDNDPMEMLGGYPKLTSGFPSAAFCREYTTHPYEATGMSNVFSTPQMWEYFCEGFVPVGIDLKAQIDDKGIVTAHTSVEWVMPAEKDDYRVEYVLVADDLTGDTQGWAQHNYYSTEAVMPPYMEQFWHKDEYVRGLHFNDVAIMTSGTKGVSGSVTTTEVGVPNEYTYTFDTSKAVTGGWDPIPFHKDKLRVVAFLIKGDGYGKVVNATKCNVTDEASKVQSAECGVQSATANAPTVNLAGQRVSTAFRGIVIKDGKKVIMK